MGDDESGAGEHLPGQDSPPMRQRTRVVITLLGSGILVASIVVLLVRHGDTAPSAGPSTKSRPAFDPGPTAPATTVCVSQDSCQEQIGVPHTVVLAARVLDRGALIDASYTAVGPDHALYVRYLSVQVGTREVDVRINQLGKPSPRPPAPAPGGLRVEDDLRGYHITIQLDGPAKGSLDRAALDRLAHDPRLLALA